MIGTANRNDYIGTGLLATYSYAFKIFAATDLRVIQRSSTDVETTLTYPLDFSVTGVGNGAGGTIVLTAVLPSGDSLMIRRVRPLNQDTDVRNQSQFSREIIEDQFDSLVMLDQQQQDQLDRCLHLPESDDPDVFDSKLPTPVAGQALAYNGSASGFTSIPTTGITVANFSSKVRIADVFSGSNGGAKVIAAIADLPSTGGVVDARGLEGAQAITSVINITKSNVTVLWPAGETTFSSLGHITIADGVSNFRIKGVGRHAIAGPSLITHSSLNYWLDVALGDVVTGVQVEDLCVSVTSTSALAGAIRVGRVTETFDELDFRNDWVLRNLLLNGPGSANIGSLAVSLTECGRILMENVTIQKFETGLVMASTTESKVIGCNIDNFRNGLQLIRLTGHPAGGFSRDRFYALQMHGPDVAATGTAIHIDTAGNTFFGLYVETLVATGVTLLNFAANGYANIFYAGSYDYTGGAGFTNHMVFAANAGYNQFYGDKVNVSVPGTTPPISMASPGALSATVSNRNTWYGCDDNTLSVLATAIAAGYAIVTSTAGGALQIGPALAINQAPVAGEAVGVTGNMHITGESRLDGMAYSNVITTLTQNSATPSVAAGNLFRTNNTVATNITNFTNGRNGQMIWIHAGDNNTTLVHGAPLQNESLANIVLTINRIRCYYKEPSAGVWVQIA